MTFMLIHKVQNVNANILCNLVFLENTSHKFDLVR
jgi:hypothetical protein